MRLNPAMWYGLESWTNAALSVEREASAAFILSFSLKSFLLTRSSHPLQVSNGSLDHEKVCVQDHHSRSTSSSVTSRAHFFLPLLLPRLVLPTALSHVTLSTVPVCHVRVFPCRTHERLPATKRLFCGKTGENKASRNLFQKKSTEPRNS